MDDKESEECLVSKCKRPFGITAAKYHCKFCGRLICWECAHDKLMNAATKQTETACPDCIKTYDRYEQDYAKKLGLILPSKEGEREREGEGEGEGEQEGEKHVSTSSEPKTSNATDTPKQEEKTRDDRQEEEEEEKQKHVTAMDWDDIFNKFYLDNPAFKTPIENCDQVNWKE
ncbi:hypothetical protein RFI_15880, partial [Reticulomyxa filosa]